MQSAAPEIDDEERSLVALTMIAAAQARRAAVDGGDVIGPLAALRPALGERPARYAFPYRTGVIVSVVLIGLVASLAVMIAATFMR